MRAAQFPALLRHMGPRWVAWRAFYAMRRRLGSLERSCPARPWADYRLDEIAADGSPEASSAWAGSRFFFTSDTLPLIHEALERHGIPSDGAVARADDVLRGRFRVFGDRTVDAGSPPDWHACPVTGARTPRNVHWSRIDDFAHGDVRSVWELNRFGFTYDLVRAFARTGDGRYARAFWELFDSWRSENPPQLGVNWKSGQEIAFRVMAWCFGLRAFADTGAATAERLSGLVEAIWVSGARIEANVGYALSQRNNHGISEATGLWTIGLLFPRLKGARHRARTGRWLLERLARDLIYEDGSFSQHSANYHRVAVECLLWSARLGDLNGQPLCGEARRRLGLAAKWMLGLQDPGTGSLPLCGANDGSIVLPLDDRPHCDYRSATGAAHFAVAGKRCLADGAWDERLAWLFGPEALASPREEISAKDFEAARGGHYVIRSDEGLAHVHAAVFRHRPSHADQLHVDIRWRGSNVALDPGTFGYNAAPPWDGVPLAGTKHHNTVAVESTDQMDRAGRFLWLPWCRATSGGVRRSERGRLALWEGQHDGYGRLPARALHRRAVILLGRDGWLVVDRLAGRRPFSAALHWLFADVPHEWSEAEARLELAFDAGPYHVGIGCSERHAASLVRADPSSARGWHAPGYLRKAPALSVLSEARGDRILWWTVLGPDAWKASLEGNRLLLDCGDGRVEVSVDPRAGERLVPKVVSLGADQDRLEV